MNNRKIAMIIACLALASTFTGCKSTFGKSAKEVQLSPQLTESELVDYYAKALSFDTIVSKNLDVDKITYETVDVGEEQSAILTQLVEQIEVELGKMTYTYNEELSKTLSETTFHYIKALLNDKKIENSKISAISQALGYYFVDVEYEVSSRSIGSIKPSATLLGLNGSFTQDYLGNDSVNTTYINIAVNNLSKYYSTNKLNKSISFNPSDSSLSMGGVDIPALKVSNTTIENKEEVQKEEVDTGVSTPGDDKKEEKPVATQSKDRAPKIDTREFNKLAGSSTSDSAYMPRLDLVYTAPGSEGKIGGIGIYPSGDGGLRKFGYDRTQTTGTMTLRYVFKSDVEDRNTIYGINIYPVMYELQSGFSANTDTITVPDFLMQEFEKLLDRSDRAIANTDLSALMSGRIYSDSGVGILAGYTSKYTNLLRNISTIRRIISRDMENNSYLIEVETVRQEGAKGADSYGTYRDKSYVTIEQIGEEFIITDSVTMLRQMTTEPDIDPDSSNTKRLIALNLAGEVPEGSKKEIEGLLDEWYKAGTARILTGPQEVKINGEKLELARGMYDVFNQDASMLPSDELEYLNSKFRQLLVKHGVNVESTYNGIITEWIGGNENQAEFMTEEIIDYGKKYAARYLQTYYLVSNHNGKWVIDDIKIVESVDKSSDELSQIIERIANN